MMRELKALDAAWRELKVLRGQKENVQYWYIGSTVRDAEFYAAHLRLENALEDFLKSTRESSK